MDEDTPVISARFARVNVVVADMERSMSFYRLLGVELGDMPAPWDAHHRPVSNLDDDVIVEFDSAVSVGNWAPDGTRFGPVR